MDDVRVSATESPEEPCSCFEGYVFLGSVVESTQDLDGEVVEIAAPPAAAATRNEVFGVGTRITKGGGVVDAFRRDPELMEVIAAAEDAVVEARVDPEDWLARALS